MNKWQKTTRSVPPIVYGWTEPFSSAGHAVAIFGSEACFQWQIDHLGVPALSATHWDTGSQLRQEPACCVMFQPYGPIKLSNVINLVAKLAVDVLLQRVTSPTERIWATSESSLLRNDGRWSDSG